MVFQLLRILEAFSGNGYKYQDVKGPLLFLGAYKRIPRTTTAVYIGERYDDQANQSYIKLDSAQPFFIFPQPVLMEKGLMISLYNNTGGATSVGVTLIIKKIAKLSG